MKQQHIPVLQKESLELLNIQKGETVIDCTLGAGGHTESFLEATGKNGFVVGIEQNPKTLKQTITTLQQYENFVAINDNFKNISAIVKKYQTQYPSLQAVHHVFFDLGLSSMELSDPDYGGSFQVDAPLNMRFDLQEESKETPTAGTIVNTWPEEQLTTIFKNYGNIKKATLLARAIIKARSVKPITTTTELAKIIITVTPQTSSTHPATTVFQALRIAVNNEYDALCSGLAGAIQLLEKNGTIACISFHSGEDRIIKNILKEHARTCVCSPSQPTCLCNTVPQLEIITKKPIVPSKEEIVKNPRARSAKLRAAQKI